MTLFAAPGACAVIPDACSTGFARRSAGSTPGRHEYTHHPYSMSSFVLMYSSCPPGGAPALFVNATYAAAEIGWRSLVAPAISVRSEMPMSTFLGPLLVLVLTLSQSFRDVYFGSAFQ